MSTILKDCKDNLADYIVVNDDLCALMQKYRLLGDSDCEAIKQKQGKLSKAYELLDILAKKNSSVEGVKKFIEVLRKVEVESHDAADILEKELNNDVPPKAETKTTNATVYGRGEVKRAFIINVGKGRPGFAADSKKLDETLKACGFDVTPCYDLTRKGIEGGLQEFKTKINNSKKKVELMVIALMSHGGESDWFDCDDGKLNVHSNIIQLFENTQDYKGLHGIPKIFLINICRGDKLDGRSGNSDATDDATPFKEKVVGSSDIALYQDMLIYFSTYDGFKSHRDPNEGTWFIQEVCNQIEKMADGETDIMDIFKEVSATLTKHKKSETGSKQTPKLEDIAFGKYKHLKYDPDM